MIELPDIPLALAADRLAVLTGRDRKATEDFIQATAPLVKARSVFDEVAATDLPELWTTPVLLDSRTAIIGVCALEISSGQPEKAANEQAFWPATIKLALESALEFTEYRLRLFLRPTGRVPGHLLIPGCPDLPLAAAQIVWHFFKSQESEDSTILPGQDLFGETNLVFVYPTGLVSPATVSACAKCGRTDCPGRKN